MVSQNIENCNDTYPIKPFLFGQACEPCMQIFALSGPILWHGNKFLTLSWKISALFREGRRVANRCEDEDGRGAGVDRAGVDDGREEEDGGGGVGSAKI